MKTIRALSVGIDQGEVLLFSDFEDGGVMWTGEGARETVSQVVFSRAYVEPPTVAVALTMWDLAKDTAARLHVEARDVSETGFCIVFRTWGDTKIARASAGWHSIGAVRDEDDWDLG